jgi:hypothetical protein
MRLFARTVASSARAKSAIRLAIFAAASLLLPACEGRGGGPAPTYSVIATVSGVTGSGLKLSDNKSSSVAVSGNGQVTLSSGLSNGASYILAVVSSPINPSETCTVSNGSGHINGANANPQVNCTTTNTAQASTLVSVDPALPLALGASITKVITPSGSGALASWIPIDLSGPLGETLAVDVSGLAPRRMTLSPR